MKKDTRGYLSVAISAIATLVKMIAGAVSLSVFTVLSAFYSCGFSIAKALCVKGRKENVAGRKAALFLAVAGVTGVSSVFYTVGAVRQILSPADFGYGLIPAIAVAAVAFYDLISALVGLVGAARKNDGFGTEMKRINLSGALAALALAQTALMSVVGEGASPSAGIFGIIAGAATAIGAAFTAAKGLSLYSAVNKAKRAADEREEKGVVTKRQSE